MKTTALLIAILTSSLSAGTLRADWVEDAVKDIRSKYNQIEGWKKRSESFSFESDFEPLSGKVTRYYSGETVVKVHFSFGAGDHGVADEYYYYHNGELFFAYISEGSWGFTGRQLPNGESETKDTATEHRLYFAGGKLIRYLRKQAESTDPAALKKLISQAENQPWQDQEYSTSIFKRGQRIPVVRTAAEVEKLLSE